MLKKYTYRLQGVFAALIQCKGICSEKKNKKLYIYTERLPRDFLIRDYEFSF